jgi:hypothetical protein
MTLSQWIKKSTTEELRILAKKCGCSTNYLYYVAANRPSTSLAKKIETATRKLNPRRVVNKESLRPDIWSK